jgi:hypothetical protein
MPILPVWLVFRHQPLFECPFNPCGWCSATNHFLNAHLIILQSTKMRCKREEEHPPCKHGPLRVLLCVPWIEIHGYNIGRPYRTTRKLLRLPVWLVFRHQPLFECPFNPRGWCSATNHFLNAHLTRVVGVPPPTTF